jgi:phosphate transport system ATP-binding protein
MPIAHVIRPEKSDCCIPVTKLATQRLSVSYNGRTVLRDVSLPIHKCCTTALLGPSGCGKSSFLMALNRLTDLIPGASLTGQVFLDGDDILAAPTNVTAVRRRIGMIFQKPNPFPFSIERNLALGLDHHGVTDRHQQRAIVEQSLQAVGLWSEVKDKLRASGLSLSGGQQQRLCIARAIALQPEVLLMDEPCSALDPYASAQVEELIRALATRFTVVIVTHNLPQAQRLSDYAALFWPHKGPSILIEAGPTGTLFTDPQQLQTRAYVQGAIG